MPYKSTKQRNFFRGCKHNPQHMKGKCPDSKTINEYEGAEIQKRAMKKGGK